MYAPGTTVQPQSFPFLERYMNRNGERKERMLRTNVGRPPFFIKKSIEKIKWNFEALSQTSMMHSHKNYLQS